MKLIKTKQTILTGGKEIPVLQAVPDGEKGLYVEQEPAFPVVDQRSKLPQ